VRAADTVWAAEGVKAAVGKRVRVVGVKGTVLTVAAT
jgi:membrane protein implicated in regulation of membrane protease activity